MKDVFAKFLCRSGTVCKDVAYEEISSGARKVHPFFHSEQPNAVLPLMICPFPQSGQRSPSLGAGGVAGIMVVGGAIFACRLWGFGRFFFRGSLFSLGCRLIFLCFRDTAIGVVRQDGMHDFGYHLLEFFQKGFGIVGFLFNQPQTAFPDTGQLGTLSSSS